MGLAHWPSEWQMQLHIHHNRRSLIGLIMSNDKVLTFGLKKEQTAFFVSILILNGRWLSYIWTASYKNSDVPHLMLEVVIQWQPETNIIWINWALLAMFLNLVLLSDKRVHWNPTIFPFTCRERRSWAADIIVSFSHFCVSRISFSCWDRLKPGNQELWYFDELLLTMTSCCLSTGSPLKDFRLANDEVGSSWHCLDTDDYINDIYWHIENTCKNWHRCLPLIFFY